mgnify:CR=1 FL=1
MWAAPPVLVLLIYGLLVSRGTSVGNWLKRRAAFSQISLTPVGRSAALLIGSVERDLLQAGAVGLHRPDLGVGRVVRWRRAVRRNTTLFSLSSNEIAA